MKRATGLGVSPGIVIGEAYLYDPELHISSRRIPQSRVEKEVARLEKALETAREEIRGTHDRIQAKLGPELAGIFSFQLFVLEDPEFLEETTALIREGRSSAAAAVHRALRGYVRRLTQMDEYMRQRSGDFLDLEQRIIRLLQGRRASFARVPEGAIVIAHDLTPSQTVSLDRRRVAGFVTEEGGHTSHTAILARNLSIPAVVGAGRLLPDVSDGDQVVVDGTAGEVILRPDRKTVQLYQKRRRSFAAFEKRLVKEYRDRPAETLDGCRVRLLGNMEFPAEIETALSLGAEGIGLYRTEYLFLGGRTLPDEDTQVAAYSEAIQVLGDLPLVIRTMDLGADKKIAGVTTLGQEFNPFLGCRSIRLCFREPDLFRTQLRAILRAAVEGDVRIMFPMISSLEELLRAREHLEEAKKELQDRGLPHRADVPVGIMIEVPGAVLIADLLAREADFFSIGTNDLIQYTLAVDRVNQTVADLYQPTHPAILRMLRRLMDVAAAASIPVSMCGEMSGNVAFAVLLAGLGLREFSTSPASIPEIKKVIRAITMREAREVANQALSMANGRETEQYLTSLARDIIPEIFPQVPVPEGGGKVG